MRAISAVLLMLVAAASRAEMSKVADTGDAVYYVDPRAIAVDGNIRRVPVVLDYAKAESGGARSRKLALEIDCASERLRSVGSGVYSEPMAAGKVLESKEMDSEWLYVAPKTGTHVPPKTPYRKVWEFVCRVLV